MLEDLNTKRILELKVLQGSAASDGSALDKNPVYQELKIQFLVFMLVIKIQEIYQ